MLEGSIKTGTPGLKNVPEHVAVNYQPIIEEGAPGYAVYNEIRSATTDTAAVPGSITTLNAPGIQEYSRAKRLAVMTYNKAHNAKSLEFIGFDDSIVRSIGDVGTITNAAYGLSSETMTLVYNQQVAPGRWLRKYEAYNANNYSDDLYSEPSVNHTTISGPNNPPTGPTPTLAEELFTDAAGVTYSRIKVNWLGYSWAYIDGYRIVVYSGETTLLDTEVDHEGLGIYTQYANPLVSGLTYTVDIYLRSNTGAYGSTPGTANITSTQGNNAFLDVGDVTNMHVYTLDGDGKYATTSQKSGSPLKGETFASRFGSSPQGAWASGETWLGNQICETTFETEVMDTGQTWSGGWKFIDVNTTTLGGATKANFVTLSGEYSPLVWVDHAGNLYSGEARYMKAKSTVSDSPLSAGYGLHVKLPIPATFLLGN